jgi:ubiquinone/menaquinone biosynthesis C-methylase UbiE
MLDRLTERVRREGLETVTCLRADLRELPLADASAEVIVSSYAFHHLDHDGKGSPSPKHAGSSVRAAGSSSAT